MINENEKKIGGYTKKEWRQIIKDGVVEDVSEEVLEFIKPNIFEKLNEKNRQITLDENIMEVEKEALQTEGRIQSDCFQWFNNNFPFLRGLMYHVPNGGTRNPIEANQFKAMGVVAGVPDLEFHFWRRTFFLECKTPTGIVSKEQKKIHQILDQHGFRVFVFRSLKEFQTIIWAILEDKSTEFSRGMTREYFNYRNQVFNYLYDLPEAEVQIIENLTAEANFDKFRGVVFEFISDGYDKIEGFEILFTNDYSGFYKNNLTEKKDVHFDGSEIQEIPKEI